MADYLSGGRIQGSSTAPLSSQLTWNAVQGSANQFQVAHKDFSSTISDTVWRLRFKLVISNYNQGNSGDNIFMFMGMADDTNNAHDDKDAIGLYLRLYSGGSQFFNAAHNQNYLHGGSHSGIGSTSAMVAGTYYVEIKRTAADSVTTTIFTDANYSSTWATANTHSISGITSLRYFTCHVGEHDNVSNHTLDGYIDDITFCDGDLTTVDYATDFSTTVSSANDASDNSDWTQPSKVAITSTTQDEKSSITNVPAGTRYEETDTSKIYYRSGTPYTAAWVERGTAPSLPLATYGIWAGSSAPSNILDYVDIDVIGNATDFGDLTIVKYNTSGAADATRGCFAGGGSTTSNVIDYITIITAGNATDFGDCTIDTRGRCGINHATYGTWMGGVASSNVIDRVTVQTTGNATDFGDLTVGRHNTAGGHSTTRGICMAGESSSGNHNVIDYITIATTGNATDFGDSTLAREAPAGVSNLTRCVTGGGYSGGGVNMMEYVTIDTTGNATDFGDMTISTYGAGGVDTASSSGRGCFGGGITNQDTIGYITISTTGNAIDFGDLTVARGSLGSVSAV